MRHELTRNHLFEMPQHLPLLAHWFVETWAPYYGENGPGDAEADLGACRSHDALPICILALSSDLIPVGTAGLRGQSVGSESHPGPWLTGLLVAPAHRGKGVADFLVGEIEAEARRLGHASVYCSVTPEQSLLARRGWKDVGRAESLRGTTLVYRLDLG